MKPILFALAAPVLALASCNAGTTTTVDSDNGAVLTSNDLAMGGANVVEVPGGEGAANDLDDLADNSAATADWVGHWVGVEGLVLDVAPDAAAGADHYTLTMRYGLNPQDEGTFKAVAKDGALHFTRPDGAQTLKPGDGDATGLKYLAGKQDCLVVKSGEGYCRD